MNTGRGGSTEAGGLEERSVDTKRFLFNAIPPKIHLQLFADTLILFPLDQGKSPLYVCWSSEAQLFQAHFPTIKAISAGEVQVYAKQGQKRVYACICLTKCGSQTEYDRVLKQEMNRIGNITHSHYVFT